MQNEYAITYQRGTLVSILLEVFAIADNASKATDKRSVFGGACMCGGSCACWFYRTQKCFTGFSRKALHSLYETQARIHIRSSLTSVIILFENVSTGGTSQ